jgi:bifunctional DNA-binding transcriptional regulator/antitoxin component of YhaV-PrlF toxin-antitoxin module
MDTYGTITPNWQIHIPVSARKKAGFCTHGRVKITATKNRVTISKINNDFVSKWSGAFKVKNPIPADKIRDYIDYSDL